MKSINRRETATSQSSVAPDPGRRSFLKGSALAVAGLASIVPFQALLNRPASAVELPYSPDYGPLAPVNDENTGLPLLNLPHGFRYISFGWTGDPMRDGTPTPELHDGMAVVATRGNQIVLVRNHELDDSGTPFARAALNYDSGARGGTTNLTFNTSTGQWLESWASLSGTVRNCAGGTTHRGSWLTCEESLKDSTTDPDFTKTHGWVFEVPAFGAADPVPLRDMGRFNHEAVAVDPVTGMVYETEDGDPASGFYRFVPNDPVSLNQGGQLQMLRVRGESQIDLSQGIAVGTKFRVIVG